MLGFRSELNVAANGLYIASVPLPFFANAATEMLGDAALGAVLLQTTVLWTLLLYGYIVAVLHVIRFI